MTDNMEGNGHRRGGELPERMRRMFSRARGSVTPHPVETEAIPTTDREALRSDLHAAVDRVMDGPAGAQSPDRLKRELQSAIGHAIEEHTAPAPAPTPMPLAPVASPPAPSEAKSHPVDRVMERLNATVERTLGNARPGMERSRAYLAAQLPRLIDRLAAVLAEIAADEQRLAQVERALIGLLRTRMKEKTAQRVAKLAVAAARAAAWRKRRGTSE
jgi:hypothetical protein